MINLQPSKIKRHRQDGAATLLMTIVLVSLVTLMILFAASWSIMQSKISSNTNRSNEAFTAADAGMEFAINYLRENRNTILANPSNGHIQNYTSTSTTNVTLANGSKYSIVYTNPEGSNYKLINIASTGTNSDTSATRTVNQLVQFGSTVVNVPNGPLITKGDTILTGSTDIVNNFGSGTVTSGGSVTMSGSSQTHPSSGGGSSPGNIKTDIQQNVSAIASQSSDNMFSSYFGVLPSSVKNNIGHYYTNTSDTNYSSTLANMTGTSIWIDQASGSTASLSGNITIGSTNNPVLLIINGNLKLSGTITIYGLIYVMGSATTDVVGNVDIVDSLVSVGTATLTGSTVVNFNPNVLSNMQTQNSMLYYAKVPGSWKDF